LETRRITGIVEFEPADLTITVRAGTTLGELRKLTAASNMMVPFDPGIHDAATVGGVLAANLSGAARASMGQPRDFTIGMRVVTADGRLTRAGGRVVKNVAGYDLCKLYIGSLGTLGVIVEATFKTIPLPLKRLGLAFEFASPDPACGVANAAFRGGLKVESALVTHADSGWRLAMGLAGTPQAVARSEFDLAAAASAAGGKHVAPAPTPELRDETIVRLEVLPPKLPAVLGELPTGVEAQPWDGLCRVGVSDATDLKTISELAAKHTATRVIERCRPDVKRDTDVFGEVPPAFELMRAIKREFDPNNVLSPGRFVGRL
jgi:glycolate oxidase FAD binding subunit